MLRCPYIASLICYQFQVECMLSHAKYNIYNKDPNAMISFEDFVKLYLNHRPAFGDNIIKIRNAFKKFSMFQENNFIISKDDFIDAFCNYGRICNL